MFVRHVSISSVKAPRGAPLARILALAAVVAAGNAGCEVLCEGPRKLGAAKRAARRIKAQIAAKKAREARLARLKRRPPLVFDPAKHTLAASRAARPGWAAAYSVQAFPGRHDVLGRLFEGAGKPAAGPLKGASLICLVRCKKQSRPDLLVDFTFGQRKVRRIGREDRVSDYFAIPFVTLAKPQPVSASVEDRDVILNNDHVGDIKGDFDGKLPLKLEDDRLAVECRGADAAALKKEVAELFDQVDQRLARFQEKKPSPRARWRAYPVKLSREIMGALSLAADLQGWTHPWMADAHSRHEIEKSKWEARNRQRILRDIAGQRPGAQKPMRPTAMTLELERLVCGPEAASIGAKKPRRRKRRRRIKQEAAEITKDDPCVAVLRLRNAGKAPQRFELFGLFASGDELLILDRTSVLHDDGTLRVVQKRYRDSSGRPITKNRSIAPGELIQALYTFGRAPSRSDASHPLPFRSREATGRPRALEVVYSHGQMKTYHVTLALQ